MIHRTIRWRQIEGDGLQQVALAPEGDGLAATGVVVGEGDAGPYAGWFHLFIDATWRVTRFAVHHAAGTGLHVEAHRPGRWIDDRNEPLPQFDGCIDIDISATPLTNTLPIRRLSWRAGQSRDLNMLYIPFDTLEPRRDRQRYTCLAPGRLFRYEGLIDGFTAEITIDEDGLVVDYPGLFRQMR
jgi:hypothetical protein